MAYRDGDRNWVIKALAITLIILGLIIVVAYFARQKVTSWLTYADADPAYVVTCAQSPARL
jgi:hypothetical protein